MSASGEREGAVMSCGRGGGPDSVEDRGSWGRAGAESVDDRTAGDGSGDGIDFFGERSENGEKGGDISILRAVNAAVSAGEGAGDTAGDVGNWGSCFGGGGLHASHPL